MHELSIALSILDIAADQAEQNGGGSVAVIHLKLGPLSGVVKEALVSAYDLAREGSPLGNATLMIEEVPIVVYCPACAAQRPAVSIQQVCCSLCGTPPSRLISGDELEVSALEIEP